jgi:hypothetical protein
MMYAFAIEYAVLHACEVKRSMLGCITEQPRSSRVPLLRCLHPQYEAHMPTIWPERRLFITWSLTVGSTEGKNQRCCRICRIPILLMIVILKGLRSLISQQTLLEMVRLSTAVSLMQLQH